MGVKLNARLRGEGLQGGVLGDRGWAERKIGFEVFQRFNQIIGNDEPTKPPPGHRKIFRKAADGDGTVGIVAGGRAGPTVGNAVVDFVGNEQASNLLAPVGNAAQLLRVDDRAGGVVGAGHNDGLGGGLYVCELVNGGLEAGVWPTGQVDDVSAEGRQGIAVGGVTGPGHDDGIARVEDREKQGDKGPGGTGGDHHIIRVGVVVFGDFLPQLRDAKRRRIAQGVGIKPVVGAADHWGGGAGGGLADAEHQRIVTLVGSPKDFHDAEWGDGGAALTNKTHYPMLKPPGRFSHRGF